MICKNATHKNVHFRKKKCMITELKFSLRRLLFCKNFKGGAGPDNIKSLPPS